MCWDAGLFLLDAAKSFFLNCSPSPQNTPPISNSQKCIFPTHRLNAQLNVNTGMIPRIVGITPEKAERKVAWCWISTSSAPLIFPTLKNQPNLGPQPPQPYILNQLSQSLCFDAIEFLFLCMKANFRQVLLQGTLTTLSGWPWPPWLTLTLTLTLTDAMQCLNNINNKQ